MYPSCISFQLTPPPFRFFQSFLKSAWLKITDVSHCALHSKSWMRGLFILWILHLSTHWIFFFLRMQSIWGENVIKTLVRYNTAKYELKSCLKRPKIKQYTFYSVNTSNMNIMNALPNSLVFLLNDKSSNFLFNWGKQWIYITITYAALRSESD